MVNREGNNLNDYPDSSINFNFHVDWLVFNDHVVIVNIKVISDVGSSNGSIVDDWTSSQEQQVVY